MLRAASIALLCLLQTPLLSGQTAGRPAYNVVLINSSVDVFTIELPPHSHSQLRQNVHDVILIALEASDLTVVNKEKQRDQLQFNDGDVRVLPSYTVDSLLNETGRDFRGVVVELKSRGLEPTGCGCSGKIERAICGCEPQHLPELWALAVGRITLAGTTLAPGQSYMGATHRDDTLLVPVTAVRLEDRADGASQPALDLEPGTAKWIPQGSHQFKNIGSNSARFVTIEF